MSDTPHIHIKPRNRWLLIDYKGLLEYRDLLWLLVRRDFVAKYRQTVLGPAWAIIQPLLMSLVFVVIFGRVAKIPTDGAPPFLFYLCGLLFWQLFAGIVQSAGNSLQGNIALFGKVYFPRIIPPMASTISQLIPFAIQVFIFGLIYFYYSLSGTNSTIETNPTLLPIVPLLLLQTLLLGLGISLCTSAITAKYRDLQHALGFIIQLWLYASPVIYSANSLGDYSWLTWANPIAAPIQGLKAALLGGGSFSMTAWAISIATTAIVLFAGMILYQRTARTFVDTA